MEANTPLDTTIADLSILVYGTGISGTSAIKLAIDRRARVHAVGAEYANVRSVLDEDRLYGEEDAYRSGLLKDIDLLVISPGVPMDSPLAREARRLGREVVGEVEFAYRFLKDERIIAVTGTNGKTTTATMLHELLKCAGRSVFLGGNIGIPLCDYVLSRKRCEFIVLELSSFQLESLVHFRASIALWLNGSYHHGERYTKEDEYLKAKSRISLNMSSSEHLIYLDDPKLKPFCQNKNFQSIPIHPKDVPERLSHFDTKNIRTIGLHNLVNFTFVLQVCELLDLDPSYFQSLLHSFKGLEHRLEKVPSPMASLVINDAKSTNFPATACALRSLGKYQGGIALIIGGKTRGKGDVPAQEFIDLVRKFCCKIVVQGESRGLLKEAFGGSAVHECRNLEEAVEYLKSCSRVDVVLFSPAFPSFDQFPDYRLRGRAFKKFVTKDKK